MKKNPKKQKVIIDTDPGHDDALAIMLAVKSEQLDIQAITTVAGNTTVDKTTRNAQAILDLIDSDLPIFSGFPEPIKRKLITAVVHGESGLDGFDTTQTPFALTQNAPQKIIEIVRRFPNEVTILTLGPLSNIARAFQIDPELPQLIPQIVTMGGAISVPGNKNRVAEFNFFVDPEAANCVFQTVVPKVLVPLDACNEVVLQITDFQKIENKKIREVLLPMMKKFIDGLIKDEGTFGILVYDALAAYFLLNPEAYDLEPMNIVIETEGEHTFGMSVAERRRYKSVQPNVNVVTALNQQKFRADFVEILGK